MRTFARIILFIEDKLFAFMDRLDYEIAKLKEEEERKK